MQLENYTAAAVFREDTASHSDFVARSISLTGEIRLPFTVLPWDRRATVAGDNRESSLSTPVGFIRHLILWFLVISHYICIF